MRTALGTLLLLGMVGAIAGREFDRLLRRKWPNRLLNVGIAAAVVLNAAVAMLLVCRLDAVVIDFGRGKLTGLEEKIVERERRQEEQQRQRMLRNP